GKYKEAETIYRRAPQGYEKVLGPEHPYTLTSMHSFALTLKTQEKLYKALSLLRQYTNQYIKI
ncbi:tetratricopeptide repeat protein, partial [Aspergillus saccharolyticus JOP 1030-1]